MINLVSIYWCLCSYTSPVKFVERIIQIKPSFRYPERHGCTHLHFFTHWLSGFLSLNLILSFFVGWKLWDQNEGWEANMARFQQRGITTAPIAPPGMTRWQRPSSSVQFCFFLPQQQLMPMLLPIFFCYRACSCNIYVLYIGLLIWALECLLAYIIFTLATRIVKVVSSYYPGKENLPW